MNNKDSSDDEKNVSTIKPKSNDNQNKENNVSFENDRLFINSGEDKKKNEALPIKSEIDNPYKNILGENNEILEN